MGHLRKVCKSHPNAVRVVNFNNPKDKTVDILTVEHAQFCDKIFTTLKVNNKNMRFEVDSGAAVTLISKSDAKKFFPKEQVYDTNIQLVSYCGKQISTLGYITVKVRVGQLVRKLNIYITEEEKGPLLGRKWLLQLQKNKSIQNFTSQLQSLHSIKIMENTQLQALLRKYARLSDPSMAKITNIQARLNLKEKANPVFLKSRPVPFRVRTQVEEEIERLTQAGILEKVDHIRNGLRPLFQ